MAASLVVLGMAGGGLVLTAPPVTAAPDDGVAESSLTRYVLDEQARTVRVRTEITVTNQQPSTESTYYFLTGHAIPIPAGARKVRATSNGTELPATTERVDGTAIVVASVSFPDLHYGKSRTIAWTYELPGAPVRSKKNSIRIGEGYAVFPLLGVGDDDSVTVEVVLPKSMALSSSVPGFEPTTKGGKTTWTVSGGFVEGGVSARDPKVYDEEKMAVGDTEVSLQSFPGDQEWLDFAEKQVSVGLPVLEELIGRKWPGGLDTIREDVSSEALGYAWFDDGAKEIVVSEDLDAVVLYHEMTHAWINPNTVQGRWLSEGLTEVVAQRAADQAGAEGQEYDRVKRRSSASFPLLTWDDVGRDVTAEVDGYGYPAAYTAVSAMISGLSPEQLTAVLTAAYEGRSAYARPGDSAATGSTDWRTFLDLVQTYDTDASAEKALRTWVLPRAEAKQLRQRARARETYAAVNRTDGDWLPPAGLRNAMASWDFDVAARAAGQLDGVSSEAAQVQAAAEAAGLPVPAAAREAYETASRAADYASLAALLPRTATATQQVGAATAAVDGLQNPLTELGELVLFLDAGAAGAREDLDAGKVEEASATAAGVEARAAWAFLAGLVALVGILAAAYAVFLGVGSPGVRRRIELLRQGSGASGPGSGSAGVPVAGSRQARPPESAQARPPGGGQGRPPEGSGEGELFGVESRPDRPRGVQQLRRDDLGVQLEKREELRRFLRDPAADQE